MDERTQEEMARNEEIFAQSLVPPQEPEPEDQSITRELLENKDLINYLEEKLKGEFWNGRVSILKYPALLKDAGINGILAIAHPISDKHNSLTYYDEDDIAEIMYHLLFEIDEFLLEKWKEVGLVENPDLPLIRIGSGFYQLKPRKPGVSMDQNQEYYLKHLKDYYVLNPRPNLAHYNLVRGIVRRIAYATIRKSYRGLTMKTIRTHVNVLEQARMGDYGKKQGEGAIGVLKKFPLFK